MSRGQGLAWRCLEAKAWPVGVSRPRPGLEVSRGQGLACKCLEAKAWPVGVSRPRPGIEVSRGQGLALRCLEAKAWPVGVSRPRLGLEDYITSRKIREIKRCFVLFWPIFITHVHKIRQTQTSIQPRQSLPHQRPRSKNMILYARLFGRHANSR